MLRSLQADGCHKRRPQSDSAPIREFRERRLVLVFMSTAVNVLDAFEFSDDMILDEEAFRKASNEFADLVTRMNQLRAEIDGMLNDLKHGFDTPAGHRFIHSCENALLTPMEQQALTIQHVSKMLSDCIDRYRDVFDEYRVLQSKINRVG